MSVKVVKVKCFLLEVITPIPIQILYVHGHFEDYARLRNIIPNFHTKVRLPVMKT